MSLEEATQRKLCKQMFGINFQQISLASMDANEIC